MPVIAKANPSPGGFSFRKRLLTRVRKIAFRGEFREGDRWRDPGRAFFDPPPAGAHRHDRPPGGSFEPYGTPPRGIRHGTITGTRPRRVPGETKRPCVMATERERSWVLPAGPSPLPFDHPLRIPRHGQLDGTFELFRLRGVAPPVTVEGHRAPHRDPWILERQGPTGSEQTVRLVHRTDTIVREAATLVGPTSVFEER